MSSTSRSHESNFVCRSFCLGIVFLLLCRDLGYCWKQGRMYRDIHGIISTTCDVFPSYCIYLTPIKKRKAQNKKEKKMRNEILTDLEAEILGYGEKGVSVMQEEDVCLYG